MKATRRPSERIALLLVIFFIAMTGYAQTKKPSQDTLIPDPEYYLELRGRVYESHGQVKETDKPTLDSAEVEVRTESGKLCIFGLTDSKGRLAFRLPLNAFCTVSFTKKGYVKKIIRIDSNVPFKDKKAYTFTFDIDIFERVDGLDVKVLDQPISQIHYRALTKSFDYDKEYTAKVNGDLMKMYREYYALKRNEDKKKKLGQPQEKTDSSQIINNSAPDSTQQKPISPKNQQARKSTSDSNSNKVQSADKRRVLSGLGSDKPKRQRLLEN